MGDRRSGSQATGYLLAIAITTAAAGLTQLTWPFFELAPISLFFVGIIVAAWYGGLGPGLLATFVGLFVCDYLFVQPYFAFWPPRRTDVTYMVSLVIVGTFVSVLSESMHRARRRAETSLSVVAAREEQFRSIESRLSGIIDSAMDAIITIDTEQCIHVFNRAAETMFLCPAANAIGQSIEQFIPQRFRPTHAQHINSFGATGVSTRSMGGARSVFGLRSDGTEFPIEASISQIESGGVKLFTVIMRDVTERQRAENRFRQVIEHAPNGMVMIDGHGMIELVNAQIEKSFGYESAELLGQPIEILVPERFRSQHPGYRDGFIANPSTRSMGSGRDLFGLRKDGTEFPVEIGLNPIQTDSGIAILGTIVDITERKLAEERLRASESRLGGIIESARDAIITVDRQQRIQVFNHAAEVMFRCPATEAIGSSLERFLPERFRAAHPAHIQAFADTGISTRAMAGSREIFGLRTDGTEFPLEASISQIEAEGQKLFTVILRDVTEHRRAEERFRQVIEHAPNGMVMVDSAAVITLVNARLKNLSVTIATS